MSEIVMFHGLINKTKGLDLFLEVAREFIDTIFLIVGDGPDRKRLEKKKLDLSLDNVIFTGWLSQSDMVRNIKNCDIGIAMRSNNQGSNYNLTTAFLQYAILRKPVLVPHRQTFDDIEYEYQYKNKTELICHLHFLLEHDYLRKIAGERAYQYAVLNHNAKKIAGERYKEVTR